jgi:hypothetical protein
MEAGRMIGDSELCLKSGPGEKITANGTQTILVKAIHRPPTGQWDGVSKETRVATSLSECVSL